MFVVPAGVMELVDVADSKSAAGNSVGVRVPPPAPNLYNPNLFPIGDGFGLLVFFERFECTYFKNGLERKVTSKPRGPRNRRGQGGLAVEPCKTGIFMVQ